MKCTNCGMELSENMKFCISCGTPVQKMKPTYREETEHKEETVEKQKEERICLHCGAVLVPGYKFCTSCGSRVSEAVSPFTPETSAAPSFTPEPYPSAASPFTSDVNPKEGLCFIPEPDPAAGDIKESQEEESEAEAMPEMSTQAADFAVNAADKGAPMDFLSGENGTRESAQKDNVPGENASEENISEETDPMKCDPEKRGAEKEISEEVMDPEEDITEEDDETLTSEIFVIVLTDLSDPQKQYKAPIEEEILIGRKRADIVISDDREISRSHCRIVLKEERLYLADAMSKNGTYYRDCRIESNQEIPIESGDTFRIGKHSFKVELNIEAL